MQELLQYFLIIPAIGFIATWPLGNDNEKWLSSIAITTISLQLLAMLSFTGYWVSQHCPVLDTQWFLVHQANTFDITVSLYFDVNSCIYGIVGSSIALLTIIYSKYYLHRDAGYKRFFSNVLLFYLGYHLVILAGNFETLFVGWEILGLTSFLLIAFYRERYLPIKNALKVLSIYRLADILLLLAIWLSHHFWHGNVKFFQFNDAALMTKYLTENYWTGLFIAILILVVAIAKSAQFPFSSWLPRAMEGPTSSSAIFYGSLSVHIGVFLLLRMYPFWSSMEGFRIVIVVLGVLTSLIAISIANVQSSVKTRIAYSSVVQIGIMFIETGMGWHTLVLFHFAGNAFLRTYQLLVSPSVLGYLIHEQFYSFVPRPPKAASRTMFRKLSYSLYVLSIKEWNLDYWLNQVLWTPFKIIGSRLGLFNFRVAMFFFIFVCAGGFIGLLFNEGISAALADALSIFFAIMSFGLILKAFAERESAFMAWGIAILAHIFILLAVANIAILPVFDVFLYLSGIGVSAILGAFCLYKIHLAEQQASLSQFYGHSYEYPRYTLLFLLACLGLIGFPITPTFIGIDLLFSNIDLHQIPVASIILLTLLFMELALFRIYARVFLGQHSKNYHEIAYRSS